MQIDKSKIERAETTLSKLQKLIASESFHSGAGCGCATCEKRNDIADALKDAANFPALVDRLKGDLESELERLAG